MKSRIYSSLIEPWQDALMWKICEIIMYYEGNENYKDKVLLIHGNSDQIVPVSYSDCAAEVYRIWSIM